VGCPPTHGHPGDSAGSSPCAWARAGRDRRSRDERRKHDSPPTAELLHRLPRRLSGGYAGLVSAGLVVLIALAVVVFIILARSIRIVPQARAGIVERRGRYQRPPNPGPPPLAP